MKAEALLFGINYVGTPSARLQGCINDVLSTADLLKRKLGFDKVTVLTDEANPTETTHAGMIRNLYAIAARSWKDGLDVVWLHYSGHGTQVVDQSGDEISGFDDALCPSDFMTAGVVLDDVVKQLLRLFNPKTRVVFVVDACHSATMGDLRWLWDVPTGCVRAENVKGDPLDVNVLMLSGCRDDQTSADAWVAKNRRFEGAMTSALLSLLQSTELPSYLNDVTKLVKRLNELVKSQGFEQVPCLSSTVDLTNPSSRFLLMPPPPPPPPAPVMARPPTRIVYGFRPGLFGRRR